MKALIVPPALGWLAGQASGCRPEAEDQGPLVESFDGEFRVLEADGIPDHETGEFPNRGCPFAIKVQDHTYRVRLAPSDLPELRPIRFWEFGVAINGVAFDPAGPDWNGDSTTGWQFEVTSEVARPYLGLDSQHAHTQPSGAYHYHALPPALLEAATELADQGTMAFVGWAADGYPIYASFGHTEAMAADSPLLPLRSSYRLRAGERPGGPGGAHDGTFVEDYEFVEGLGDLDAANGRFGVTPEFPEGTYYYVLTEQFPYIPRFFRGEPHESFGAHARGPGLAGVPPGLRGYMG